MSVNLDNFLIHPETLESLINGNLLTQICIDIYRGVILKNKKSLFSVVLTEIFTFIVVIILVIPITLIVIRRLFTISENSTQVNQLLLLLLAICLGLMLLINIYLWQQSQKHKSLAILVEKAEQYNNLIQSIKLAKNLESINPLNNLETWEIQHQDLIEALTVIKDSLKQGFIVERIIRKHQKMINNGNELMNNIENNLTALMTFELSQSNTNYQELFQDAIQIGITVHKEVKKLSNN